MCCHSASLRVAALPDLDQGDGKPMRRPAGRTGSVGAWRHRRESHRAPEASLVAIRAADTAVVKAGAGRRVEAGQHDKWARTMSAELRTARIDWRARTLKEQLPSPRYCWGNEPFVCGLAFHFEVELSFCNARGDRAGASTSRVCRARTRRAYRGEREASWRTLTPAPCSRPWR